MKKVLILAFIGILVLIILDNLSGKNRTQMKPTNVIRPSSKQSTRLIEKQNEVRTTIDRTRNKIREEMKRG